MHDHDSKVRRWTKLETGQELRERSCGSKARFGSMEIAKEACVSMARAGKTGTHPYECPHCGFFHIGRTRRNEGTDWMTARNNSAK